MKLTALVIALAGLVDAQNPPVSPLATPTQRSFVFQSKSQHQHIPARIRARHDDGTVDSENWSGYAVTGASGSVTDVTGSWIVPVANCTSGPLTGYASFWVGIDGFTSSTVEQIGTDSDCSSGTPTYYVWYEFYPSPSFVIGSLTISPGDVISAEVKYTGSGQFTASITVVSTGKTFSISHTVSSALRSSAEWIAEAPSSSSGILPLANFGSVLFGYDQSGVAGTCYATVSGTAGPIGSFGTNVSAITMVSGSGATEAVPTALSSDGTSFSVNYVAPAAPALSITKTHSGDFTQGETNAAYTVTVSNQAGAAATSGTVTVEETPPSGLTLASMSGAGWSCGGATCSRSDSLAGGTSYPAITVLVNVAANASSPQVNQVSVSGGGSTTATASDSTTIIATTTPITIQTDPEGLQFSIDGGTAQTAPQTLNLSQGSHTIAVATTQAGAAGTEYVFTSWSDGGAASHTITVSGTSATYTASFKTQYQLGLSASPAVGGTFTPASGGFYDSGSVVPITATANSGYTFTSWTGPVANAGSASTTVTMSAPESVTANFSSLAGITIQTSPVGLQFSLDGTVYTAPQVLSLSSGPHTLAVVTTQAGSPGTEYVFTSWSDGGAASHTITVSGAPATYTASFKTQYQLALSASPPAGGTFTPASGGFYDSGSVVPVTATANSGYSFTSWTGPVASAGSASTTVTMSAPESVTANFSPLTPITIQTSPPGLQFSLDGTVYTAPQTLNLAPGPHTLAVVATQAGSAGTQYVFISWSDGGAASHTITVSGTAATYTASFKTQYQLGLSVSPAAGGTFTPASGGFYDSGSVVPITATANFGYAFTNWTGAVASASSASTTVTMVAPETVTANFSLLTITIQTSPPGLQFTLDVTVYTAPQTLSMAPGPHTLAVVTTQAGAAGTQYVFTSWSDGGAASHTITVGGASVTYTAIFKTQYQLALSASPPAGGTFTPASGGFYDSGSVVPVTATANSGYSFTSWFGAVASAGSASTSVTMSAPHTVTASFSAVAGITIQTSQPGLQFSLDGTVYIAPQTLNLSPGPHTLAVVTTQAGSPGTEYVFISWSDGGAASHIITVTGTAATYTASFKTQYQLALSASPAAGGTFTPASGGFYDSGSVVPVTATANSGYSFTSWTGPVASAGSASTTVTMVAPETVSANFTAVTGHPAFFAGEVALGSGVYYLQFPDGNLFGYYAYTGGGFIDHFDMGYEYVDPVSSGNGVYLWDYTSGHWFYTNASLFPYLYDFTLNAWIYYFPDTKNAGRYTTNPRYFVNLATNVVFTM